MLSLKRFTSRKTGKPGPVIIDIAKDAQNNEALFQYPETVDIRSYKPQVHGDPAQIAKAAALIKEAKRPMLYAGRRCRPCQCQRGTTAS